LVEQLPSTALVPVPHVALSHSAFAWQPMVPVEQLPTTEPVPVPQAFESQSAAI
jgi:hypothetical protein